MYVVGTQDQCARIDAEGEVTVSVLPNRSSVIHAAPDGKTIWTGDGRTGSRTQVPELSVRDVRARRAAGLRRGSQGVHDGGGRDGLRRHGRLPRDPPGRGRQGPEDRARLLTGPAHAGATARPRPGSSSTPRRSPSPCHAAMAASGTGSPWASKNIIFGCPPSRPAAFRRSARSSRSTSISRRTSPSKPLRSWASLAINAS